MVKTATLKDFHEEKNLKRLLNDMELPMFWQIDKENSDNS